MKIGGKIIKASSSVKLLGVQVDDQLNFKLHISNICKSAADQLNALIKLKSFLDFEEKKTRIKKRALRFLHGNHDLSYESILLLEKVQ